MADQRYKGILVDSERVLIIFYRNPELGKVKTRLAATIGDGNALEIYHKLIDHTRRVVDTLPVRKIIYYSHRVDTDDGWNNKQFEKAVQRGDSLGERMLVAFESCFEKKNKSVCIIGTDCFELTTGIVEEAFEALLTADAVIGPARDGGYYLLGMTRFIPQLFLNKTWSTPNVMIDTIRDLEDLKLTYRQLPVLRDVDQEEDLPISLRKEQ